MGAELGASRSISSGSAMGESLESLLGKLLGAELGFVLGKDGISDGTERLGNKHRCRRIIFPSFLAVDMILVTVKMKDSSTRKVPTSYAFKKV